MQRSSCSQSSLYVRMFYGQTSMKEGIMQSLPSKASNARPVQDQWSRLKLVAARLRPCSGPLQGQGLTDMKRKRSPGQQPACKAKQQMPHRKAWAEWMLTSTWQRLERQRRVLCAWCSLMSWWLHADVSASISCTCKSAAAWPFC